MNRTKSRTTELELSRLPTFDRNAVIAAYQPYKTAPVDWQIVQPLAIEIGHLLPDLSERTLRNRMWHISQLLLWAHLKRGVPLNVERMLDPNLVDEWIHKCGWSESPWV